MRVKEQEISGFINPYTCIAENCHNQRQIKNMCRKHYAQFGRHGKFLDKTRYDPNDINIINDTCEIILRNNKNNIVGITLIDINDLKIIKKYKWGLGNHGYASTHTNGTIKLLHQILNTNWYMTDHKDTNKLNNKRSNLRECNHTTNAQNSKKKINCSSRYKGVRFSKRKNKWAVSICINGKHKHLGYFKTERYAASIYDKNANIHFGEFARTNLKVAE